MMNRIFRSVMLVGLGFLAPLNANAEITGDQIMKRLDAALTVNSSNIYHSELITEEKGKKPKVLRFQVFIKGNKWRRIDFQSPGDLKGMRILSLDIGQMYTYLPAYKKVRRIASHVKAQGFMGTAFSHDEMAIATYGNVYQAKLTSSDDKQWKVELQRRPGQIFPYPKLEMEIRKDIQLPSLIRYFNDKGTLIKTETRASYVCEHGHCVSRILSIVDHTRNDIKSTIVQRKWNLKANLDDSFFTVRALQRRR